VLTYCQQRRHRNCLPIKGASGARPIWPARVSRTKTNQHVWVVGSDTAKDTLYGRLRIAEPGPGYVHFPIGAPFDAEYFAQLTSEVVRTRFNEGRPYRVWVLPPGKRNEALDTAAYALAARHATRIRLDLAPRHEPSPAEELLDDEAPLPRAPVEPETGPLTRPQPPQHRDRDPNEYHSLLLESRQPRNWVRDGGRLPGWWDRSR
jgi:phage terminase large subunit GpA-like protein